MTRKAVLLSIKEDVNEMSNLLKTLDISVDRMVVQRRSSPHRNTFLGPGKIEETVNDIEKTDIDLVVVNGILKPSQHHTLEMRFKKECVDRVGIILKIFSEHAHTDEAKRQVTLATLRYELPFLREWIHKAKSGERPGFLSGGAYATEVYYEHSRSHIRRIEEELRTRSQQRELRRKRRRSEGYFLVSLAGYTNAGKSAVMNALCDSEVEVDGRLFSTLSTTTRRLSTSRKHLLLTDTVGFIKDLPPDLVNAFNSTLEEIFLADLILLVIDVSEPSEVIREKLETSKAILTARLQGQIIIVVGNKVDRLSSLRAREVKDVLCDKVPQSTVVLMSASNRDGIEHLVAVIEAAAEGESRIKASLPMTDVALSLISSLHDTAVIDQKMLSDRIEVIVICTKRAAPKISARIQAVGGSVLPNDEPLREEGTV